MGIDVPKFAPMKISHYNTITKHPYAQYHDSGPHPFKM
jgi:hypothetical protein